MKKRISILTVCLIALFLSTGMGLAASGGKIEKIQFETPSADEDRVTFQLDGPHLPKIFALKGDRPRVVFDFPNTFPTKKVQNTIQVDGTFIQRIRSGIHKGANPKTRIVFDLTPGKDTDFEQDFDQATNALVIRIFATGSAPSPLKTDQAEKKPPVEQPAAAPVQEKEPEVVAATTEEPEAQVPQKVEPVAEKTETVSQTQPEAQEARQPEQQVASIPEAEKAASVDKPEESTVIQPLSEIGDTEKQAAAKPSSPVLYSIEFDDNSNRGEMILFKLNEFYPPVVFGIEEDIPRIVCFFKGTSAGEELEDLIESNGQHVKAIRVGKYQNPDNIRVVLDLVPDKNYDLQQIFFKDDNLFMIIINTSGDKVSG